MNKSVHINKAVWNLTGRPITREISNYHPAWTRWCLGKNMLASAQRCRRFILRSWALDPVRRFTQNRLEIMQRFNATTMASNQQSYSCYRIYSIPLRNLKVGEWHFHWWTSPKLSKRNNVSRFCNIFQSCSAHISHSVMLYGLKPFSNL